MMNYENGMPVASLRLAENASKAVAFCAIGTAMGVVKKCRENAATNSQYGKFSEMLREGAMLANCLKNDVNTSFECTGDFTQIYWTVHETLLQCIEKYCTMNVFQTAINYIVNTGNEYTTEELQKVCKCVFSAKMPVKCVDKRVRIQVLTSKKVKKIYLSAFQIASRAARSFIESHVAPDCRRSKVVYLAEKARIFDENGMTYEEMVYTEFPYSVIDGTGDYYRDIAETMKIDEFIKKMNLTENQIHVISRRLQGYGNKAIASENGTSKQAVQSCLKQIRKKYYKFAVTNYSVDRMELIVDILMNELTADFGKNVPEKHEPLTIPENTYTRAEWLKSASFDDYF